MFGARRYSVSSQKGRKLGRLARAKSHFLKEGHGSLYQIKKSIMNIANIYDTIHCIIVYIWTSCAMFSLKPWLSRQLQAACHICCWLLILMCPLAAFGSTWILLTLDHVDQWGHGMRSFLQNWFLNLTWLQRDSPSNFNVCWEVFRSRLADSAWFGQDENDEPPGGLGQLYCRCKCLNWCGTGMFG